VDLTDETFWHRGLGQIEALIDDAESLAESASVPSEGRPTSEPSA
jgi:hypothetical protein